MTVEAVEEVLVRFDATQDWEARMRLLIEVGRSTPTLPKAQRIEMNRVPGCSGRAWLVCRPWGDRVSVAVYADSPVVHGMMGVVATLYDGMTPTEALAADPDSVLARLGLGEFMGTQRVTGMKGFLARIRREVETMAGSPATA